MDRRLFLKAVWLPGLLLSMIVGILFFRNHHLDQLDATIASDSMRLDSRRALLASIGELRKELTAVSRSMERDYKQLFELAKAESMVEIINNMAAYYGIEMIDFKFQIPEYVEKRLQADKTIPYLIQFEAKFKGDYVPVGKFIESLEKRIFLDEINSVRLVANEAGGNEVISDIRGVVRFI